MEKGGKGDNQNRDVLQYFEKKEREIIKHSKLHRQS